MKSFGNKEAKKGKIERSWFLLQRAFVKMDVHRRGKNMSISPRSKAWAHVRFAAALLVAWALALGVSVKDAVPPVRASLALLKQKDVWQIPKNLEESLDRQRQIQAHYLSYGVYIPLDDIVIGAQDSRSQPLMKPIEGICGSTTPAVWVPVAFHFPIFGEKVFEWCLVRT